MTSSCQPRGPLNQVITNIMQIVLSFVHILDARLSIHAPQRDEQAILSVYFTIFIRVSSTTNDMLQVR